jgi:hypothetical protein
MFVARAPIRMSLRAVATGQDHLDLIRPGLDVNPMLAVTPRHHRGQQRQPARAAREMKREQSEHRKSAGDTAVLATV